MVEHAAVNRGVVGSSPTRGAFLIKRLHGQAVKTSPFHGGNTGSIPVGVTDIVNDINSVRRTPRKNAVAFFRKEEQRNEMRTEFTKSE